MNGNVNHYEILGVPKNASQEQIKSSYKKLARKYHPDVSKEPNAEEMMIKINLAYEILSDPQKRKDYDHFADSVGSTNNQNQGSSQNAPGQRANASWKNMRPAAGAKIDPTINIYGRFGIDINSSNDEIAFAIYVTESIVSMWINARKDIKRKEDIITTLNTAKAAINDSSIKSKIDANIPSSYSNPYKNVTIDYLNETNKNDKLLKDLKNLKATKLQLENLFNKFRSYSTQILADGKITPQEAEGYNNINRTIDSKSNIYNRTMQSVQMNMINSRRTVMFNYSSKDEFLEESKLFSYINKEFVKDFNDMEQKVISFQNEHKKIHQRVSMTPQAKKAAAGGGFGMIFLIMMLMIIFMN